MFFYRNESDDKALGVILLLFVIYGFVTKFWVHIVVLLVIAVPLSVYLYKKRREQAEERKHDEERLATFSSTVTLGVAGLRAEITPHDVTVLTGSERVAHPDLPQVIRALKIGFARWEALKGTTMPGVELQERNGKFVQVNVNGPRDGVCLSGCSEAIRDQETLVAVTRVLSKVSFQGKRLKQEASLAALRPKSRHEQFRSVIGASLTR